MMSQLSANHGCPEGQGLEISRIKAQENSVSMPEARVALVRSFCLCNSSVFFANGFHGRECHLVW